MKTLNMRHLKLSTRLCLLFICITIVFVPLIAVFSHHEIVLLVENQNSEATLNKFTLSENSISAIFSQTDNIITQLATDYNVQLLLNNDFETVADQQIAINEAVKVMRSVSAIYDPIHSICLLTNDVLICVSYGSVRCIYGDEIPQIAYDLSETASFSHVSVYSSIAFSQYHYTQQDATVIPAVRVLGNERKHSIIVNVDQSAVANLLPNESDSQHYIFSMSGDVIVKNTAFQEDDRIAWDSVNATIDLSKSISTYGNNMGQQVFCYKSVPLNWLFVRVSPRSEYMNMIIQINVKIVLLTISVVFMFSLIAFTAIRRITRPIAQLANAMNQLGSGDFTVRIPETQTDELSILSTKFNEMSSKICDLLEQNRIAETHALRAQINPHFLFNTLRSIEYMAEMSGTSNVASALKSFSAILQPLFKVTSDMSTIQKEVDFLYNYTSLLSCRMGKMIEINFDIPNKLRHIEIKRFLLQPLVENAILHGATDSMLGFQLLIHAHLEERLIVISIRNNGQRIPSERLEELRTNIQSAKTDYNLESSSHIGLANISRRLHLFYGDNGMLTIQSDDAYTEVSIRYPVS